MTKLGNIAEIVSKDSTNENFTVVLETRAFTFPKLQLSPKVGCKVLLGRTFVDRRTSLKSE